MLQSFYNWYYRHFPQEMVSWWMHKEAVRAKVTEAPDGSYVMWMEGEKYPFPGYPRGHLLYGSLSPLKHQIKNQIFNEAWAKLEADEPSEAVINYIKHTALPRILKLGYECRHDMLPPFRFTPAVREIHRALTVAGCPDGLRDIICFIFQEDDAYRFRFQWLATYFRKGALEKGFDLMEHAEVVDDMKERVRLVKRIFLLLLCDKGFSDTWEQFTRVVDWDKVKLSKADKYFFRAKYFKVDYPHNQY